MGDMDERQAHLGLDALELELHLAAQLEVERTERLVEQEYRRSVDDGTRQRHTLLLTSRQLGRLALGHLLELDQLEGVGDLGVNVLDPASLEPEAHVLLDVHVREQRVVLEHRVHRTAVRLLVGDVRVADADPAGSGRLKTGDHSQRRGLAAAGRAEQGEERTLRHLQAQVVHSGEIAE